MEQIGSILIGVIAGLLILAQLWRRRRADKPASSAAKPQPNVAPPAVAPKQLSLSERLHGLETVIAPFASNSAHPRELVQQREFNEAKQLLADAAIPVETVMQYAQGVNWVLACAALAALAARADGNQVTERIIAHFDKLAPWPHYFALEYFIAVEPRPPVGAAVAAAKDWWRDNQVNSRLLRRQSKARRCCRLRVHAHSVLGLAASIDQELSGARAASARGGARQRARQDSAGDLRSRAAYVLRPFLDARVRARSLGATRRVARKSHDRRARVVTRPAELVSSRDPPRSLLVSGDRNVGKTSFLRLLAERLAKRGWVVFEASGADLMAGQQWFGQLEGRVRQAVDELAIGKKAIWYIPDLLQLGRSGTHQGQSASILDQILPAISAGRLVVWTEANATGTARLLQLRPALRSLLEVVRLEPLSEAETASLARSLVERLSDETALAIHPECADGALDAARQYLGPGSFPGSVLDLIKLTIVRAARSGGEAIAPHHIIETLSQLTGLPVSILDDKEKLDLASIREFFGARVMG